MSSPEPQALEPVALVRRVKGVGAEREAAHDRGHALLRQHRQKRQRSAQPHERGRRAACALERPGRELQRRVAGVEQRGIGEVEVARTAPRRRGSAARSSRSTSAAICAALCPGASRMLSCARATDGITVRGSPAVSMFTSTDGLAPRCAPRTPRPRRPPPPRRRPRRSCRRRSAGAPTTRAPRRSSGATPARSSSRARPSGPGSTSRSTSISTCVAFSTAPP